VRDGTVVAAGTAKGVFLIDADGVSEPMLRGDRIPSVAFDTRRDPVRLLAGTVSDHWGPGVRISDDRGATWSDPERRTMRFPDDTGASLVQVWQLRTAGDDQPGRIWAGVEPAAMFRSDDSGETWSFARGIWDHPHRTEWMPGGGGLGLHTILLDPRDPDRLHIAISAGGVYRSEDGGETWVARNNGIRAAGLADEFPECGQCVHKMGRDAADPDRLYIQNHGGLYRSDDDGDTWVDIAEGVPSDFGFPIVVHPHRPDTAYVIPLDSDEFRCTAEGKCRVYRTTDAGASWEPLGKGLPQDDAWLAVLRDAACHDGDDPVGIYFGTRTGQVFGSDDEGETWSLLAENLPPVLCVRAARLA
jgi:photosystem II stability/assembly factor-like uncharacterized protein